MKTELPTTALNGLQRFIEIVRGIDSPIEKTALRKRSKQRRAYTRFWRHSTFATHGHRQSERYLRNNMIEQQKNSHKPPALWPRHLGPSPWVEQREAVP